MDDKTDYSKMDHVALLRCLTFIQMNLRKIGKASSADAIKEAKERIFRLSELEK